MSKGWKAFLKNEKRGNRGFTIIELITAIAIMGVLSVTVIFLMSSSSKTYNRLSVESQLQSEAQLVANSITELAIDSFDAKDELPEDYVGVGNPTYDGESLLLDTTAEGVKKQYMIVPVESENALYLVQRTYDATSSAWVHNASTDKALLANYISDFTVDTSRVADENMLEFALSYEKNGRVYNGKYQVLMRNRAYADDEETPGSGGSAERMDIRVEPDLVYLDVIRNQVEGYHIGTIGENSISYGQGVEFTANVVSNFGANKDVKWQLKNEDEDIFAMTIEEGEKSKLTFSTSKKDFKDSAIDMFMLVITKTSATSEGKVINASPRTAQILLRRVKSLNLYALSGTTLWDERFTELYKGTESSEAAGYAYKGATGSYMPIQLNASISSANLAYGGGLSWKIEMKNSSGAWVPCTNSSLASLADADGITKTSTSMTVNLGSAAKNGDLYRVTATSLFDDSFSDTYIFGVAPSGNADDTGFYSRGYYTNMSNFYKGTNIKGEEIGEVVYLTIEEITGSNTINDKSKIPNYVKVIYQNGQYYVYIDYDAFLYNDSQKADFYKGKFKIHFCIGFARYEGDKTYYYINGKNAETNKADMAAKLGITKDEIISGSYTGNTSYANDEIIYELKPVVVSKISPERSIFVVKKGESKNVYVKTAFYNLLLPRNGMYYFGAYINDFENNLAQPGKEHINAYFSLQLTSDYGDTNRFVDTMSLQLTAKQQKLQPKYLANPATLRLTANDYYLIQQDRDSYTDYLVAIANVEGTDAYVQGPEGTSGNPLAWSDGQKKDIEDGKEVLIYGQDVNGNVVNAKVYREGSKYYCKIGGKTYKYNTTYKFWQK